LKFEGKGHIGIDLRENFIDRKCIAGKMIPGLPGMEMFSYSANTVVIKV
jgi:hypothetical protein